MKIFENVAGLAAAHLKDGQIVETKGYTSPGDGGQARYLIQTAVQYTGTPDEFGDHTLANGNIAALQYSGEINVRWFGAVGDGVSDDTAGIQAAINFVGVLGGGEIYFPDGDYSITETITVSTSNTVLLAAGQNGYHDAGGITYSARLSWGGVSDGVMLEVAPVEGASNGKLVGCGLRGVTLEGNNLAGYGLIVKSHNNGEWVFHAQRFTQRAVSFDVVTTLGESRDCQRNTGNITVRQVGSSGACVWLGGDAGANFSLNTINFDMQHQNGEGIIFSNTDNNFYPFIRVLRAAGGTGVGITAEGGDSLLEAARDEVFMYCQPGAGGIIVKGTVSFTAASKNIRILHYDGQAGGTITVEVGASLFRTQNDSVAVDGIFSDITVADSTTQAATQFAAKGSESLRLFNGSSNHAVLVDGVGNSWAVGIDSSTGNFRILRLSGSGNILLARKLELTGQTTQTSAPAAGGAAALPATPAGYLDVTINGTLRKVAFY